MPQIACQVVFGVTQTGDEDQEDDSVAMMTKAELTRTLILYFVSLLDLFSAALWVGAW